MGFMDKMQSGLEQFVGPVAEKVSTNKFITAMSQGFMCLMPVTLGMAVIAVFSNFPIAAWIDFLKNIGIYDLAQDSVSVTLSMSAIYVAAAIGYCYTRNDKKNAIAGAMVCMGSFLVLAPVQHVANESGATSKMLMTSTMGSEGIFIALLVGMFCGWLFCTLMDKNLTLKMPDSVPPMVSSSLSPMFVAMIIFSLMFVVKYLCSFTPYGNIFSLVNTLIGTPLTNVGATPAAMIIVTVVTNLFWFFGVHPNSVMMCYMPVFMAAMSANMQAFVDGKPLPYLTYGVVVGVCQIGGAGNTHGLCMSTIFAKSEKYKTMRKVVIPANIFNINEPVIFGFPVMMNPIYFIPMLLSPVLSGFWALLVTKFVTFTMNPTINMPWVTPSFVTTFLQGGIGYLCVWIVSLLLHILVYLPFFKIDDAKACELERAQGQAE